MVDADPAARNAPPAPPVPRAPSPVERVRTSTGVRVALILVVAVIALAIAVFVMVHRSHGQAASAPVAPPKSRSGLIGGVGYGNRYYRHKARQYVVRQEKRAAARGQIAMPTPTNQFHRTHHHPKRVVRAAQATVMRGEKGPATPSRPPALGEIQDLMASWRRPGVPIAVIGLPPRKSPRRHASGVSGPSAKARSLSVSSTKPSQAPATGAPAIIIPAGQIDYAVTILAVNSNVPGPVECRLTSGPFRGDNMLGSFQDVHERLVLALHQIILANGHSEAISALAISPKSGLPAVRGTVDHHYLERYGLLFAGAYLQGYGQAFQQNGSTAVTGSGLAITTNNTAQYASRAALGSLGQTMAQQFTQDANIPATVSLPSGAGMGVLFMKPVTAQAAP